MLSRAEGSSPAGELSGQAAPPLSYSSSSCHLGIASRAARHHSPPAFDREFDQACVGRVEAALKRVSAAQTRRVVFDLQGLSSLDSRGLMTILRANEWARTEPFEVVVVRPRGLVSRLFTLTRAGEQLTILDHIPSISRAA